NVRPVRIGARLLEATTWAKVLALLVLSVAAILFARPDAPVRELAMEPRTFGGAGLALILVLGAYDGWQWVPQLGGEMRDPRRDLPRAILFGLIAVTAVFLVANVANLLVLAPDELEHSPLVTADVAARLLGPAGTSLVALLVVVSTFSSNHSGMMTDPRVLYAMAEDGLFPRAVARLHPRHRTPHVAVILIGAAAALYLYARTFEELVATFVLGMWPFLALSIAAVIVQRVRKPDLPRPYRVPLYPLVPIFFLLACAGIFANSFVEEPRFTLVNLGVLAAGLPVYALWRWKQRRA
ncbi:MAG: amino acid permease, partial [Planctomycetes bacterium]|nr:amino acid permease [Planctomycetota bacterium]